MALRTKISATRPRGRYRVQQRFVAGDAEKFKHILCARTEIYLKGVQEHHTPLVNRIYTFLLLKL